jgi:hypothetical protein
VVSDPGSAFRARARAATVRYLRSAPTARSSSQASLLQAYRVALAALGDPKMALAMMFGPLGYDAPFSDFELMASRVVRDSAKRLAAASLYVMSPQMCDVVVAAAQSLTTEDLQLLDETDFPTPTGCLVLPHPVVVSSASGELGDLRAFVWSASGTKRVSTPMGPLDATAGVRIDGYLDSYGPIQPDTFRQVAAAAAADRTPLPPLSRYEHRYLPYRLPSDDRGVVDQWREAAQSVAERDNAAAAAAGLDETRTTGEYTPGGRDRRPGHDLHLPVSVRVLAAVRADDHRADYGAGQPRGPACSRAPGPTRRCAGHSAP